VNGLEGVAKSAGNQAMFLEISHGWMSWHSVQGAHNLQQHQLWKASNTLRASKEVNKERQEKKGINA
jgi:hypothetical protein